MICNVKAHKLHEDENKWICGHYCTRISIILATVAFLMFCCTGTTTATTVYVATDGTGDYNTDGVNDHVEINQALSYISETGGGTVHIKEGTYIINNTLWINGSNTILEGEGDLSVLKIIDFAEWDIFVRMIEIRNDKITIQNLKIDGNRGNQTLPTGSNYLDLVYVNSGADVIIQNNTISNGICDGILAYWAKNLMVLDNIFVNMNHDAISGRYDDSIISRNTLITTAGNGGNAAIRAYNGANNTFFNNYIERTPIGDWGAWGFEIHQYNNNNASGNRFLNNIVNGSYTCGMYFDSTGTDPSLVMDNEIHGNIIYGITSNSDDWGQGIKISGLWNNMKIDNNVVFKAKTGVYEIGAGDDISLKNNIIVGNRQYGIDGTNQIISEYNDIWDNALGNYQGVNEGINDIHVDPLFYDSEKYDFHLKSAFDRWTGTSWTNDSVTSTLIDAGDPDDDNSNEPSPNGGRINIGAYGNTPYASKSAVITDIYPTASAGSDQTAIINESINFDGSESSDDSGIVFYAWDFDDSNGIQQDATGDVVSHTYGTAGTYIATLTVTDTDGNTDTDTAMITVQDAGSSLPTASAGSDRTATVGDSISFDGSGSTDDNGIVSYIWDFDSSNGLQQDATGAEVSHTYDTAGTYNVTLTVNDTDGNTDTDTAMITVLEALSSSSIYISPSSSLVAPGETFTVDVTISPGEPIIDAQFDLNFDSSLLTVNSVTEGNLFSQEGALTDFSSGTIDNIAGTVTNVYGSILTNISSEEVLATITLTAGGTGGVSALDLSNVMLSDVNSNSASCTINDATVRINSPPSITSLEPAPGAMFDETDVIAIDVSASDADEQSLSYTIKIDDVICGTVSSYEWTTDYSSAGTHTIDVIVSDGISETTVQRTITINDVQPRWDVNEDNIVDFLDLTIIGEEYGTSLEEPYPRWDVNQDSVVNILDMTITSSHFGETIV